MASAKNLNRLSLFVLFCVCGFLGNWFRINLFFNVEFLSGSVFSMLAIMVLGPAYGIASAFIAGTCTYLIWNHPWAVLIFTGEAAAVSWMYTRHKGNLVMYDMAYWFVIGIPLVYLFYHQVMGISIQSTLVIMLKQPVNGVTNTLLATISLSLYRFLRKSKGIRTAYSELLFNAMAAFAILPIFLLSVYSIRAHQDNSMKMLRSQVSWVAESARKNLREWIATHHNNVQILSTLVKDPKNSAFEEMQHYVEVIRSATPEFKGMGVFNDRAVTVAYSPLAQDGRSNLGVDMSGRAHIQIMKKTGKPYITDVLMSRLGKPTPIVVLAAPIIFSNEYKGYCSGVLELDRVSGLLANLRKPETHITIVDGHNRVIASTRSDYGIMAPFSQPYIKAGENMHPQQTHLWQPAPRPNISPMQQWADSFLFNDSRIPGESRWRVIVEASLLPVAQSTSQYCLAWLAIQALLIFAAILISHLVSNRLIAGIKRLQLLTRSVPQLFHDSARIQWPASRVRELFELTENFKDMTASLIKHHAEQVTAEQRLRESEEKYRTMMEAMNDGAYICSSDFRIEYLNPAMIRQIGQNVIGSVCHKAIHGLDRQCPWCTMAVIQRGERTEVEVESPKNGRFYVVSNSAFVHSDGTVSKMAIYRDITQIREAELRIRQSQKLEAIGTLAAGIAHDFNNILTPITGFSEMLMDDLPESNPEWENVAEINRSARRAIDLVKQILSFSRQADKMQVLVRIQDILKEAYILMRSTIPSNIPLKQSIQKDCPPVLADPSQLHQIAMNLLTNAFHAVEEKGGEIQLELKESRVTNNKQTGVLLTPGNYAVMSVSDTGGGIDPGNLDKIFEPYFTTKKEGKGTGLGLSVVYGIVKDHGGDICVLNEPGRGVRFDVYIPVHEDRVANHPVTQTRVHLPTGNERILLVDDEESVAKLEETMLNRLGYRVTAFSDSQNTLEVFKSDPNNFDLVVSDMAMPHMTGVQMIAVIRSIRPDIPVIICTGFSERFDQEMAKALGVNGFLMKPVRQADMARMVRTVLDESGHTHNPGQNC